MQRKAADDASEVKASLCQIRFSRNFGKEAAIMAGLAQAQGDCCVVIDCDLQHPPVTIIEMYRLWQHGYQIVEGRKRNRGRESWLHRWAAHSFYCLISKLTKLDLAQASDFKLLDRRVVDALLQMQEQPAFFRALSSWVGFKTARLEFDVQERTLGSSKWSTLALIKYAITNIASFSTLPLQLTTVIGVVIVLAALILACGGGGSSIAFYATYVIALGQWNHDDLSRYSRLLSSQDLSRSSSATQVSHRPDYS